jgi:glycosyltransferase involved in cell wall biosynthesis
MNRNFSVLHLIPHGGGGIGAVLRALLESERREGASRNSSIVCLERLNDITRLHCDSLGIPWVDCIAMEGGIEKLPSLFERADIVLLHWWNHPLLMRLLFQGLPPSRLMLWSHVNGFAAPQAFFPELFELPDLFVFATYASLQSPVARELSQELTHKLRVIRSCAGIPADAVSSFEKDGPFKFGYVGTVEPAKMHPDFLKLCVSANIQTQCIVAGGPAHNELRSQADILGVGNRFNILGPVDDPMPIYKSLHAFAYPLNPAHYGTGEQVLIEAMAYGAVPVVLDNPPEKALIRHGETGLIANDAEEFAMAIRFLADNPVERNRLAEAGRRFVLDECDIKNSVNNFTTLYQEMLPLPKCPRRLRLPSFDSIVDGSPFHLFLASCGSDIIRNLFIMLDNSADHVMPSEFTSATRGTPRHYRCLLGNDPNLDRICGIQTGAIA